MIGIKTHNRPVLWLVLVAFLVNTLITVPVQADVPFLPAAGSIVSLTPSFSPSVILGLKVFKNNPFKFEFVISQPDAMRVENPLAQKLFLKKEARMLIKYFLAALTVPKKDMWVNLSPYQRDRIVPQELGITEMGKEMLAQDYLLKQVTASVMYPEGRIGHEFWQKIYQAAYKRFGTTEIPVNTFNKVWIIPDNAVVYENSVDNTVVIVKSKLKVMLEEDYQALNKSSALKGGNKDTDANRQLSNALIRQVILPLIEKEVNEGENFASLRQVYNSLILAFWYKNKLKESLIGKGYVDRKKINGVEVQDKNIDQEIYKQYLKSYKKGVYNYIREDLSPTNEIVPRKYFSGGVNWGMLAVGTVSGHSSAQKAFEILRSVHPFILPVELAGEYASEASVKLSPAKIESLTNRGLYYKGKHAVYLYLNRLASASRASIFRPVEKNAIVNLEDFVIPDAVRGVSPQYANAAMLGGIGKKLAALVLGLAILTGANVASAKGEYNAAHHGSPQAITQQVQSPNDIQIQTLSEKIGSLKASIEGIHGGYLLKNFDLVQHTRAEIKTLQGELKTLQGATTHVSHQNITSQNDTGTPSVGVHSSHSPEGGSSAPSVHPDLDQNQDSNLQSQGTTPTVQATAPTTHTAPSTIQTPAPATAPTITPTGHVLTAPALSTSPTVPFKLYSTDSVNGATNNYTFQIDNNLIHDYMIATNWSSLQNTLTSTNAPYVAIVETNQNNEYHIIRSFNKWQGDGSGHDTNSYLDFLYGSGYSPDGKPNVSLNMLVNTNSGTFLPDIANSGSWERVDNPDQIEQLRKEGRAFSVQAVWIDEKGHQHSGLVYGSYKAAGMDKQMQEQAAKDKEYTSELLKVTSLPNVNAQDNLIDQFGNLPPAGNNNTNIGGNIIIGAYVSRDQMGNITNVNNWIYSRDLSVEKNAVPFPHQSLMIYSNGKNPQPLKFYPYSSSPALHTYSLFDPTEINMMTSSNSQAGMFLYSYVPGYGPAPLSRGEVFLGENEILKRYLDNQALENYADHENIALKQYKDYLHKDMILHLSTAAVNLGLSFTGVGNYPISAGADFIFNQVERPDRIGRYVPTQDELQRFFEEYNKAHPQEKQFNWNNGKIVINNNGTNNISEYYTSRDLDLLNKWIKGKNTEKVASFIGGQISELMIVLSYELPTKTKISGVNQYQAPQNEALYHFLAQDIGSVLGEFNLVGIYSVASGNGLQYVSISQEMSSKASMFDRVFSQLGVTIDGRSLINQVVGHKVFKLAPSKLRINFYLAGFSFSELFERQLVDNIDQILSSTNSYAYIIEDGHFKSKAVAFTPEEFRSLYKVAVPIGKVGKISPVDGRPMEVPVFEVENISPSGEISHEVVIFTAKALQEAGRSIQHELDLYNGYSKVLADGNGSVLISYASAGGTLGQNIYTGLRVSSSQQDHNSFPSSYSYDNGLGNLVFIKMGMLEPVRKNLDFFTNVMSAQIKLKGKFQGIAKSYNAYTGDSVDSPDIGGTGEIALSIMAYEKATGDLRYHQLLTESVNWLLDMQDENGGKALPNSPVGGKKFYTEPNSLTYAVFNNFANNYNNSDGNLSLKAAEGAQKILTWLQGVWTEDQHLFKVGEGQNAFSADAQTRTFLALGSQAFMANFLNNDPQQLGQFLKSIANSFGVTIINHHTGLEVSGLDLANDQQAQARITQDNTSAGKRMVFTEVTGEYLVVLRSAIESGLLNSDDLKWAQDTYQKYGQQLAGMADQNGNLPQATALGGDTGFNGLSEIGSFSFAPGAQYQLFIRGVNIFDLNGKDMGNTLGLTTAQINIPHHLLSYDELNLESKFLGANDYTNWFNFHHKLLEQENAGNHNPNVIHIDPNQLIYRNTDGQIMVINFIHSRQRIEAELKLAEQGFKMSEEMTQALTGAGPYAHGGVVFSTLDGKRIGDQVYTNVDDVLKFVSRLSQQERSYINFMHWSDVELDNFNLDGTNQDLRATIIFPVNKTVPSDVTDSHGVTTTSIYSNGLLRFTVDDNTVTIFDYDTGVERMSKSYQIPVGGRDQVITNLTDDSKSLEARQNEISMDNEFKITGQTTTTRAFKPFDAKVQKAGELNTNDIWIVKRAVDALGNVSTQEYGLFSLPMHEYNKDTVTENQFDAKGNLVGSKQYKNKTGSLDSYEKGQELFNNTVIVNPSSPSSLDTHMTGKVNDFFKALPQDIQDSLTSNQQSLVLQQDMVHGTTNLVVFDNHHFGRYSAKYVMDQFTNQMLLNQNGGMDLNLNPEYKVDTIVIPEYNDQIGSGHIPALTREYTLTANGNKLIKVSRTTEYNSATHQTTVEEQEVKCKVAGEDQLGEVTKKVLEPIFGLSLSETKIDSLGRTEIVTNSYSPDYLKVTSETFRIDGVDKKINSGNPVLLVQTTGTYDKEHHQLTLTQTNLGYEKGKEGRHEASFTSSIVTSILSSGGHLFYQDTVFPQSTYTNSLGDTYHQDNLRHIPVYDEEGNVSRSLEGTVTNGVFTLKQSTVFSGYEDFYGTATNSITSRLIKGKWYAFTSSTLLTTPEEYHSNTNQLTFELTSKVFDQTNAPTKWTQTNDRDGRLIQKAFGNEAGRQVTAFTNFNIFNAPTTASTDIHQNNGTVTPFTSSEDVTSDSEALSGLARVQIINHLDGSVRQELKNRNGIVIENDTGKLDKDGNFDTQRRSGHNNLNELDIARDSLTQSKLSGQFVPYTSSHLLSTPEEILANHHIKVEAQNLFLSGTNNEVVWQEIQDFYGHVTDYFKGYKTNGVFNITRNIHSSYRGVPGLINVSDSTRTTMWVDDQEKVQADGTPLVVDESRLLTAHDGNVIDDSNINTIPVQDIFNSVHKVRYQGSSHFDEFDHLTSSLQSYQEIRNNLGNVEITQFGHGEGKNFTMDRSLYRIYDYLNGYGNVDVAKSTITTTVMEKKQADGTSLMQEDVTSQSYNTSITTEDKLLVYQTIKGIGVDGLNLGSSVFGNYDNIVKALSGLDHVLNFNHHVESLTQVKDADGKEVFIFSGYSLTATNGFGQGNPFLVVKNTYDQNKVSQPIAYESHTFIWTEDMGSPEPGDNFNKLIDTLKKSSPIATYNNLSFGTHIMPDGATNNIASYDANDSRETGMDTFSMRLDGTKFSNHYLGVGEPASFNLYFDHYELPAYGMTLNDDGSETPFSIYLQTLFDDGNKSYVLIDEFRYPSNNTNDTFNLNGVTPDSSILLDNGNIVLTKKGHAESTTPFSSVLSLNDMFRNGLVDVSVTMMPFLQTDAEKVMDHGHELVKTHEQELQNNTAPAVEQGTNSQVKTPEIQISPEVKNLKFEEKTWWQKAGQNVLWFGKQVAGLFGIGAALYGVMAGILGYRYISKAAVKKLDTNNASIQDYTDIGFTPEQAGIIMNDRFKNGAFKDAEDFKVRLEARLKGVHAKSAKWLSRTIAIKRQENSLRMMEVINYKPIIEVVNAFTQADLDSLKETSTSVESFMAKLHEIYGVKEEQEPSYRSALAMFKKYLSQEQLDNIVDSRTFKEKLVGFYSKENAIEVILRLMFEKIRDDKGYKKAVRDRVDKIIEDIGFGKAFPDQVYALRDTFLKNIENARLLPEGLRFHDFDIDSDLLAYSWDDLRKAPDMKRQVRSELVSIEKLFVFQVIYQRGLWGLAGQGRAEEYLWAKYIYPSIQNNGGILKDPNILPRIKAFKQVFHALLTEEMNVRFEDNRDPKGKVVYFQNLINEEVYNDAFRYLLGQKDPTYEDAGWSLPSDVKEQIEPLRKKLADLLDSINDDVNAKDEDRIKAINAKAVEIRSVMLAFVGAVDQKIGSTVVKGRINEWKLNILPWIKLAWDGKMRRRIFSQGGPYNQTALDNVRRWGNKAVIGVVSLGFMALTFNLIGFVPVAALAHWLGLTSLSHVPVIGGILYGIAHWTGLSHVTGLYKLIVPPHFFTTPWSLISAAATSLGLLGITSTIKFFALKWLNKRLENASKEQKENTLKNFSRTVKALYFGQAIALVGATIFAPVIAPLLHISAGLHPIYAPIRWFFYAIPYLIFLDTWRLSFYAMNHLLSGLVLHRFYVINNVYEINNKSKTGLIMERLNNLFKDGTPALGTAYKTRGQERLASFINVVEEMTSGKDGYFYTEDLTKDGQKKLTVELSRLAKDLVDEKGDFVQANLDTLNEEIEDYVNRVSEPIEIDGKKDNRNEKRGIQVVIDYINGNYRLDKGVPPLSMEHLLPFTVASNGFTEDYYYTSDLLVIVRGEFKEDDIIKETSSAVLEELKKNKILIPGASKGSVKVNTQLSEDEVKAIIAHENIKINDAVIKFLSESRAKQGGEIKGEDIIKETSRDVLEKLIDSGLLLKEESSNMVRVNTNLSESNIRQIAISMGIDLSKIERLLKASRAAQGEAQEFTHRLGMLAKYKTELFLNMVKRLTVEGSMERQELLKMIDNPVYIPKELEKWNIWERGRVFKGDIEAIAQGAFDQLITAGLIDENGGINKVIKEVSGMGIKLSDDPDENKEKLGEILQLMRDAPNITEWANLQLPTGYANDMTNTRALRRIYSYYAQIFNVEVFDKQKILDIGKTDAGDVAVGQGILNALENKGFIKIEGDKVSVLTGLEKRMDDIKHTVGERWFDEVWDILRETDPELVAKDRVRLVDRNIAAMDALNKVLVRRLTKQGFIVNFSDTNNGEKIYGWLIRNGYFYAEKRKFVSLEYNFLPDDVVPKELSVDSEKKIKEQFPQQADAIIKMFKDATSNKLREVVDVLVETNYSSTYKDGRGIEEKELYDLIQRNQAPVIGGTKYNSLMLKKAMDLIRYDRMIPALLFNTAKNPLISESYHSAKWNAKTSILPFLIGPVILNLDADHKANYVDYEFVPNHLLEYFYNPGLAVSTPVVKHTMTKGLGIFGDVLPVGENAFYYHSQQAKELFGGTTATGKLFERVSALRHSEGITDSYVAEDAQTAVNYRRFGYITAKVGSIKVEKGWPFSFGAALTPTRKWSYSSVEAAKGRVSMKVFASPLVDWPFLANNYWLDGYGFYFKKPGIVRYVRWLVAFYLLLDWNLFNNVPFAAWIGSLILSQAISQGLFFYKIYDESNGFIKGSALAIKHIITKMYIYFVHQVFVFEETILKLAVEGLGKFIPTAAKGANQTRIENKELLYARSNFAIQTSTLLSAVVLALVGLSVKKAGFWFMTISMGFAGVAAVSVLNPVRTKNRVRDNLANGLDVARSLGWGMTDVVEGLQYRLTQTPKWVNKWLPSIAGIINSANSVEDKLQVKVLEMVENRLREPFSKVRSSPAKNAIFSGAFGAQGEAAFEMTEILYLFHQNPGHYRRLYGRVTLPVVFKLLKILQTTVEGDSYEFKGNDFNEEGVVNKGKLLEIVPDEVIIGEFIKEMIVTNTSDTEITLMKGLNDKKQDVENIARSIIERTETDPAKVEDKVKSVWNLLKGASSKPEDVLTALEKDGIVPPDKKEGETSIDVLNNLLGDADLPKKLKFDQQKLSVEGGFLFARLNKGEVLSDFEIKKLNRLIWGVKYGKLVPVNRYVNYTGNIDRSDLSDYRSFLWTRLWEVHQYLKALNMVDGAATQIKKVEDDQLKEVENTLRPYIHMKEFDALEKLIADLGVSDFVAGDLNVDALRKSIKEGKRAIDRLLLAKLVPIPKKLEVLNDMYGEDFIGPLNEFLKMKDFRDKVAEDIKGKTFDKEIEELLNKADLSDDEAVRLNKTILEVIYSSEIRRNPVIKGTKLDRSLIRIPRKKISDIDPNIVPKLINAKIVSELSADELLVNPNLDQDVLKGILGDDAKRIWPILDTCYWELNSSSNEYRLRLTATFLTKDEVAKILGVDYRNLKETKARMDILNKVLDLIGNPVTANDLDRADYLLNQVSWMPKEVEDKDTFRAGFMNFLQNIATNTIGVGALIQASSIYIVLPIGSLYDKLFKSKEKASDYQKALQIPKSTVVKILPKAVVVAPAPKADNAMSGIAYQGKNRIAKPMGPTGGIDFSKTGVEVSPNSGNIQITFDDPEILRLLLNADGLTPIIYDVKAMTPSMANHFVGLDY